MEGWDLRALAVLERLNAAGHRAVLVGGCVRDRLMGRTPHDYDAATSARPEQIREACAPMRVVETGVRHGTVTVLSGGLPVEVTTFRREGRYTDHRRPDRVEFTGDLGEDLARRDFTINAMAWEPSGLTDPFGGRADLAAGVIRCVGEPERRFGEDALRLLRALRFAAQCVYQHARRPHLGHTVLPVYDVRQLLHRHCGVREPDCLLHGQLRLGPPQDLSDRLRRADFAGPALRFGLQRLELYPAHGRWQHRAGFRGFPRQQPTAARRQPHLPAVLRHPLGLEF